MLFSLVRPLMRIYVDGMWGKFQLIIPSDNTAMASFYMVIEPPPSIFTLFIPLVREVGLVWLKE
jgi:hypothetical protein